MDNTPESKTPVRAWRKTKIALAIAIGLGCLHLLITLIYQSGHVHYYIHKDDLQSIAREADALDIPCGFIWELEPNTTLIASEEDGTSRVSCDRKTCRRFVIIDLNGPLGRHGYVYAQDPAVLNENSEGFPMSEVREFDRVDDQWWSFTTLKP